MQVVIYSSGDRPQLWYETLPDKSDAITSRKVTLDRTQPESAPHRIRLQEDVFGTLTSCYEWYENKLLLDRSQQREVAMKRARVASRDDKTVRVYQTSREDNKLVAIFLDGKLAPGFHRNRFVKRQTN